MFYTMALAGLLYNWNGSNSSNFSRVKTDFHELCPDLVSLTSVLIFTCMSPAIQIFSIPVLQGGGNVTGYLSCAKQGLSKVDLSKCLQLLSLRWRNHEKQDLRDEGLYGVGNERPPPRSAHQAEQATAVKKLLCSFCRAQSYCHSLWSTLRGLSLLQCFLFIRQTSASGHSVVIFDHYEFLGKEGKKVNDDQKDHKTLLWLYCRLCNVNSIK